MLSSLRPMVFECMHLDSYRLRPGLITASTMIENTLALI